PIPAGPSILTGRTLPPVGGDTQFADMRAAFDALSDDDKALVAGRIGEHSLFHSRRRDGFDDFTDEERVTWKPVPQALVRTHPESGRKALFAGSHLGAIQGMDDQEAAPLIDRLNDHAAEDRFVHTHEWALGDVVVWDNRCVLHRGMPYDKAKYVRNMRRTTVAGLGLTVENGAAVDEYAAAHAAG
ncbi:MAG: TauD/TfdA family dioxygenase, partial [Rhodospirillales bacterium]|nr:TauD/TfdA family dioxygenase [Rhodospirillales bacterium]